MIRVLYLGAFSEPTNDEWKVARALERAGCHVERLNERDTDCNSFVKAAQQYEPDLLLLAKGRMKGADGDWPGAAIPLCAALELARPHCGKIVCWQFDLMCREFQPARQEWSELVANACDIFVMTDGFTAQSIPNAAVVRQGMPDDVEQDCPWDCEIRGDVLFLGTAYRDRQDLVESLRRRFGERFHHENNIRGKDLTGLIRSYRICVGPHYPRFADYWSDRIYVITGHGGLFACPVVPGMDGDGWKAGQNYLALPDEPEAMCDKLQEYLTKTDRHQLAAIRSAGFEHANAHCSYDARVRQLLAMVAAEPSDDAIKISNGDPVVIDDWGYDAPEEPTELEADAATPSEAVRLAADPVALQSPEEGESGQSIAA